ncbi:MAG TPA: efflux RND transporter periplasmic adaptor subunit [Chitinophagaceae bacterium]|nr:efflux RND transporter periplasmic adaptor subunit [Chitinophagaceae bacterium]
MKFQSFHFFTAGIIAIVLLACGSSDKKTTTQSASGSPGSQPGAKQPPMPVDIYIIKPSLINAKIEVSGSLLANETTEIHPEISGRLVQLNIAEGKFVNKGALLAKIYDGDLQAQLRKLQVQLEIANTNEERSSQLLKIQGISKADYDASVLNVNNIKADIEITRANITKTEIRAPFSGKLGLKNISPGAFIVPSTVLTTISQVNKLKIQFSVPEKYGSEIKNGQHISFKVNGSPKTFSAAVIATETSIGEDTRSLTVRALVNNNDPALIPGTFANVEMILGNNPNAIMIPNSAVLPQGRKKQVFVFKNNKALPTEITTGVRDSANVQVLTGLFPGDTLITSGLLFLRPGSDVKLLPSKTTKG